MTDVLSHARQDSRVFLNPAEEGVAARTEHPSDLAGSVVMVDEQVALNLTDQATSVLGSTHRFDVSRSESVLSHKSGAQVLRSGCFRVRGTPSTEPLVSALSVGLPVLAIAGADTRSALASLKTIWRELPRLALHVADPTRHRHTCSMARVSDTAPRPDQPCHADVLLELANGQVR